MATTASEWRSLRLVHEQIGKRKPVKIFLIAVAYPDLPQMSRYFAVEVKYLLHKYCNIEMHSS